MYIYFSKNGYKWKYKKLIILDKIVTWAVSSMN